MAKAHIIKLQGQEFITYEGLLSKAHEMGLKRVTERIVEIPTDQNNRRAVVTAEVELEGGRIFTGIGDADASNVNKMIAQHTLRMASTRAKARAFRDATNMGMASIEELGPDGVAPMVGERTDASTLEQGAAGEFRGTGSSHPAKPKAEPKPEPEVWQGGEPKDAKDAFQALYDESTALIQELGMSSDNLKAYCKSHNWPTTRKEMNPAQLGALVRYLKSKTKSAS